MGEIVPSRHGFQDGFGAGPKSTEQRGLCEHDGVIVISARLCEHSPYIAKTRQFHQHPEAVTFSS